MNKLHQFCLLTLGFMMLCIIFPPAAFLLILIWIASYFLRNFSPSLFVTLLLRDALRAVWHWIFGAPRVRAEIVERNRPPR